jgi:hypothetical protein
MPAAVYAVASDTLIGVVRAWVLARARQQGETVADDGLSPLAAAAGLALWLLRLSLAPRSTLTGFRSWVITDCPVAPGLRPGHLAEVEAARQDADQRIALAAREHDEALEEAAAAARQAHDEATRARRGAGSGPSSTGPAPTQPARHAGSRRRGPGTRRPARAAGQQAERLRTELQQVREDAARLVGQCGFPPPGSPPWRRRPPTAGRTRRDGRGPPGRAPPSRTSAGARREARSPGSRGGRATKRDQMIELAGQRRDLASVPLAEVSQLASSVAAEIGYSPDGPSRAGPVCPRPAGRLRQSQSTPDKEERRSDD